MNKNKDKKRIAFILNTTGLTGGVKVVFEYAVRFAAEGHKVYIVHLLKLDGGTKGSTIAFLKKIKHLIKKIYNQDKISWFPLKKVEVLRLINLKNLPKIDIVIATANETADWVNDFQREGVKKFYFIQDYENWTRDPSLVDKTYKYPLKKIVISSWLKKTLNKKLKANIKKVVVNGINLKIFDCPNKKFNKNKKILMLYHILPKKGIKYGLKAFKIAKKKFPEIKLTLFGAYKPKEKLPEGTKFFLTPPRKKLKKLYQKSDIFISPSLQEGCGLTPMEAMSAKCAVVSTNVGGIPDYAIPNKTAIIVPAKDSQALAAGIIKLLQDEKKMEEIAQGGYLYIQNFSWKKAYQKLKKIILR